MDIMIQARALTKRYGDFEALRNLNLKISKGELFGLLGPNGAGKTTTIGMLTGTVSITSGSATVDGLDVIENSSDVKRVIGYLPENPFLYDKMTGEEFLSFVGSIYGLDHPNKIEKIDRLLHLFDMTEVAHDLIETYSFGMRKKIAICSTLLHEPKVLFWDEPTGGLDPESAFTAKQLLKGLSEKGVTILFATHILEVAENLCHRVGIIISGDLRAVLSPDELKAEGHSLEKVFMRLTGGQKTNEINEVVTTFRNVSSAVEKTDDSED